jgi:AmmeMemoRadiSam system protein B
VNGKIRDPAVAGMFYPADPAELRRMVEELLAAEPAGAGPSPKAVIAPHAGYIYSGPTAAGAYARIRSDGIRRVVLLGPSHRVFLNGVGASSAAEWSTPLGNVPVEAPADIPVNDIAHAEEHSLEVQLPFLQVVLDGFTLVPLVVGEASTEAVADILAALWGGDETLIVISSDLSHYENYETARQLDAAASRAITELDPEGLNAGSACGRIPIRGLLHLAGQKGMRVEQVDLRNSGDTAGSRDQVVGYGAYAFYE